MSFGLRVLAILTGGAGGNGILGAAGGSGGGASLSSAITATTNENVFLTQSVLGGAGGNGSLIAAGGLGGNASSALDRSGPSRCQLNKRSRAELRNRLWSIGSFRETIDVAKSSSPNVVKQPSPNVFRMFHFVMATSGICLFYPP
jgi:hypothetical protein